MSSHVASAVEQSADEQTQTGTLRSPLIPKGREADYWEMATASEFLDIKIDRANMYVAPQIITNASEDRDGEITNPDGLIDAAYKVCPVVFLQHSHRIAPMMPPVGTAETPDRKYDLHRIGDAWYSGCRFTQATKFARQVFRLVDDGVLRGRSIGALNHKLTPYKPRLPGVAFMNNQIVPTRTKSVSHDQYELIEWSWVWMPANRDIVTPPRDVVPVLKSIMSKGRLDDTPIDPALQVFFKSLNLAEPASNLQHSGRVRYWPFREAVSVKGQAMSDTPVAITFDSQRFTPVQAKRFLASCSDIGVIDTPLELTVQDGAKVFKSVQLAWSGPTHVEKSEQVPGLFLHFAKAAPTDDVDVEAATAPAAAQPVAEAVAAAAAAGAEQQDEPAVVDAATDKATEAMLKMPAGRRYLMALVKKATEVVDEAEAAMEEQEPELMEKCKQFTSELRGFIGKVAAFNAERYGKLDGEEATAAEEEQPVTAMLEKAVRADLFYGRKFIQPKAMVKGLSLLKEFASDDRQRQLASTMLKGVVAIEDQPQPAPQQTAEQLRQLLLERLKARMVDQLT